MRLPRTVLGMGLLVLGLAACGPSPTPIASPTPTESASPTPTPTPTPEPSVPTSVVLSLDAVTVVDQTGQPLSVAPFADPAAGLALFGGLYGYTPDPEDQRKFGTYYTWPEVRFIENFSAGSVRIESPQVAGLEASTTQGISVGSTRAEVLALDPVVIPSDGDGDGLPDSYGLEARVADGFESLVNPGQPGVDYLVIRLQSDTVVSIGGPGGDYRDI